MTRLDLIRAAAVKPRQPAGEVLAGRLEERAAVLVAPRRKPHPIQRTHHCAKCRAGWQLSYGKHTIRRSSGGTAWCAICSRFVAYVRERFAEHFGNGKSRRGMCSGSGQPIPQEGR